MPVEQRRKLFYNFSMTIIDYELTGQKNWYRYEEATYRTCATDTGFLQIFIVPSIKHGRSDQLDGKQKLYGTYQQAA